MGNQANPRGAVTMPSNWPGSKNDDDDGDDDDDDDGDDCTTTTVGCP